MSSARTVSITRSAGGKTVAQVTEEGQGWRCQVTTTGDSSKLAENIQAAGREVDRQKQVLRDAGVL